ncbi:MAG: DUF4307 domain-containing protein [Mycobacterium sp.]
MIERPIERYGRPGPSRTARRWILVGLSILLLLAGVGIAVVGYQRLGTADAEGTLAGYEIVDDETVSVTVSVTREDPSQPAVCIVRARSIDGSETGRREVLIEPSDRTTVQVTTIVKASRAPVVGDVYGCGVDVPPYLVAE